MFTFTKYAKSKDQIRHELSTFVFAEVVKTIPIGAHFYGFCDELDIASRQKTGKRIFFQKTTQHVTGVHVGPVHVCPPRTDGTDLAAGDLLCGEVAVSQKGTYFTQWMPHVSPLFYFVHYLSRRITGKKNSRTIYEKLALSTQPYPDDLWALFLLLSAGNVLDFVFELLPNASSRIRHPVRRTSQFQSARGFDLSRPVQDFLFLTACFAHDSEIYDGFRTLCEKKGVNIDRKYGEYIASLSQ